MGSVDSGVSYFVVFAVAAITTAALTPLVGRVARRIGAIDRPSDPRKVHTEPVPTIGGVAIVAGFLLALAVASRLPDFAGVFELTSEPAGLVLGVLAIGALGIVDDLRDLPPNMKLAGQIVAALIPAFFGIQIVYAWIPGLDVIAVASDIGLPLTVIAMVAMINAVNLIDGLDGLAAGIVGIAAVAFFIFTVTGSSRGLAEAAPSSAPIVAAALAGVCLGFLFHNFHPATIFMGDTGSMTLGLLLASAGVAYVGRTTAPANADLAGTVPLLIPALVLAIPFVDVLWSVVRRLYRRQPITRPDKEHLHHVLIAFGHSHRRAVVVLYAWSVVLAYAVLGPALLRRAPYLAVLVALVVVAGSITVGGLRGARDEGDADDQDDDDGEAGASVTSLRAHADRAGPRRLG